MIHTHDFQEINNVTLLYQQEESGHAHSLETILHSFSSLSHSVLVMKYIQRNTSVKMYLDSTKYINDLTKQICTLKWETKDVWGNARYGHSELEKKV